MVYLSASVPIYIHYYFWKFYIFVPVLCTVLSILLFVQIKNFMGFFDRKVKTSIRLFVNVLYMNIVYGR
jgi:hypothetical protein